MQKGMGGEGGKKQVELSETGSRERIHAWRRHFYRKKRERIGNPRGELKSKLSSLRDSQSKEQEGAGSRGDRGRCHPRALTSHCIQSSHQHNYHEGILIPILQVGRLRPRMGKQLAQIGT